VVEADECIRADRQAMRERKLAATAAPIASTAGAATILVVDDDADSRFVLRAIFERHGFTVELVDSGEAALSRVAESPPAIVLMDLHMPGLGGMETLARLRRRTPDVPVIMLTGAGNIDTAVAAIKLGAQDFLTRPINNEELVLRVRRALERRQLEDEVKTLRGRLVAEGPLAMLLSNSATTRRLVEQVRQVGPSAMTVLVLGETGTGKELVARGIHHESGRGAQPFVAIDCGAIPGTLLESELFGHEKGSFTGADQKRVGRFQLAQGGSVFFDEIGNLPPLLQAKLLRVLQEREIQPLGARRPLPIDVRFIAATNESLEARIDDGQFREDLYYRLAEFTITIPPLRDRVDDIAGLARQFLEEASVELRRAVFGFSPAALDALRGHSWPGNVRELRSVVRHAALQAPGTVIEAEHVRPLLARGRRPPTAEASVPVSLGRPLKEIASAACAVAEKHAIVLALRATRGNKTKAAKLLEIDFKTLHLKMKKLGLDGPKPD
jgi:DNA-binding NtrC family response regulator